MAAWAAPKAVPHGATATAPGKAGAGVREPDGDRVRRALDEYGLPAGPDAVLLLGHAEEQLVLVVEGRLMGVEVLGQLRVGGEERSLARPMNAATCPSGSRMGKMIRSRNTSINRSGLSRVGLESPATTRSSGEKSIPLK
ncbi:hypothetical protein ACLQ20_24735 [Micromonospora sp. DT46]